MVFFLLSPAMGNLIYFIYLYFILYNKCCFCLFVCLFVCCFSLKAEEAAKQHLNPLKVIHCLEQVMSTKSIIVADGGDFVGTAAYVLR